MESLKNKILKLCQWRYFPLLIFTLGMSVIHICIKLGSRDDAWFFETLNHTDKLSFLISRYNGWTSRILIEYGLVTLVRHGLAWRILDTLIMILTIVSISKIFSCNNCRKTIWIIISLSLMIPFSFYGEAGWIATTLNYSWPLAFGLFSMISIKKILFNEKINWYEYIFYIPALIFASNQEQMCAIVLAVYLVFTIYLFINRKWNWYMIFQTLLCIGSILFTLTNPGNAARRAFSVTSSFPDFDNISIFRKIEMGFSSSLFEFIMKPNIIFTLFCGLLLLCMVITHSNKVYRWIASIPFASSLIFGIFNSFFGNIFPGILKIKESMTNYGTGIAFASIRSWIPDIILSVILLAICFSLYVIFENKKESMLIIFIFLLGFGSRMLMAFSPTIWASGARTFMFMYFAFIICSIILYKVILKSKIIKYDVLSTNIILVTACISYLNSVCL